MHSFKAKFGSKQVVRASRDAFNAVAKQVCKGGNERGAIFCQLKEDGSRFLLTGVYLPPKWANRINKVLQEYKKELQEGYEPEEDDIPF